MDKETLSPLVGVNVLVDGTHFGAASDILGKYHISNLPAGTYNLSFEMIGYAKLRKLNIPVNPEKSQRLDVKLEKQSLIGEEIIVTGNVYIKPLDATVSNMNLDFTDLMKDAGSIMDVQRMMQALPSVVSSTDQNNEIIVRGGNPSENLFIIDNIEIPNPNHYGNQGEGGGPVSMIDPLFVQEVDFYAGAFPARFGGKASSVMDIRQREGSRDNLHGTMDMGMAGIGLNFNGPLNEGKGSYIIGFKKSYLDLIAGGFGLTAIPHYYNIQGKMVYDISPANRLIVNGIFGNDKIFIKEDYDNQDVGELRQLVDFKSKTYVGGVTLKTLYSQNSYSLLTLSKVGKIWLTEVKDRLDSNTKKLVYNQKDHESEWTFKGDYFTRLNNKNNIRIGFNFKAISFDNNEFIKGDSVWQYSYFNISDPDVSIPFPGVKYDEEKYDFRPEKLLYTHETQNINTNFKSWKTSTFIHYKYKPVKKLELNGGLRYSWFEYSDQSYLSTRAGLSYFITGITTLNFGLGSHFQEPSYHYFTINKEKNKKLKSYNSQQFVLGLDQFLDESTKLSAEVYYKTYRNLPVSKYWIEGDSIDFYNREMTSRQDGRSMGIELFLQKKLMKKFHYTISYAHYISEYKDVRKDKNTWYTGDFDFRDVLTVIGGYKTDNRDKNWYKTLNSYSWWKFVDWLVSPGDELEISTRFRYSQGRPYSLQYYDPYMRDWYVKNSSEINTERLPAYHRLDLMINRRWIHKKSSLVAYINILNLYNQKNLWGYIYNYNGTKTKIFQFEIMPVGGFIWEF
ncbi:MAG: TonB-dependent receptor [Candidatus Marinimicrobia bacterium]|nr:TonB-dependent receptor [Candidatus Neomarinimicrobiota bacterium]